MKERPILMSAPMVRAILDGRKTVTRRVMKPQPDGEPAPMEAWSRGLAGACHDHNPCAEKVKAHADRLRGRVFPFCGKHGMYSPTCPYGQPGDRLWVREAFGHFERNDTLKPGDTIYYRADGECVELQPWRPSIHMPRWASRITLEVTGVRVEKLQDISEADAIAEGIEAEGDEWRDYLMPHTQCCLTPRSSYRTLWESIHGPGSWDANPFVWVVTFRRIDHA